VTTLQSTHIEVGGAFVVTVVAPTAAVFQALLSAINRINPEGFQPIGPMDHTKAAALQRDQKTVYAHVPPFVVEGDAPIGPRSCATGACEAD